MSDLMYVVSFLMLTIAALARPMPHSDGQRKSLASKLQFDLCAAWNKEQTICDTILGHWCSFCTKPDARHAAWRTECVTNKGVKRAEEGEAECLAAAFHQRAAHSRFCPAA